MKRKNSMKWTMLLSCMILLSGCLASTRIKNVDITEYGIFEANKTKKVAAKSTAAGVRSLVKDVKIQKETDIIPGVVGAKFGINLVINTDPPGRRVRIKKVTLYPPIGLKNPDRDEISYKSEYDRYFPSGKELYTGYSFDEEWEVVLGKWTIQLWYEDEKIAEKTFTVVDPAN